jgi:DNA-binding NtrC family response regulator
MSSGTVNVLLVDDDASYASVVQHLLKQFSARKFFVSWHNNGSSAIEEIAKNKDIQIILMDYYLPEKNGLEIVKQLRDDGIETPVIFLTSNKNFKIAVEAMKYNVEDYLIKDETAGSILPRTILTALERDRIKKQIQKMEKDKTLSEKKADAIRELIVTICHEFNNPLAAIKISSDIISKQNLDESVKEILLRLSGNLTKIEKEIITLRDLDIKEMTQP